MVQGMELWNFCRGRHLYSAGRPWLRASAHILVVVIIVTSACILTDEWWRCVINSWRTLWWWVWIHTTTQPRKVVQLEHSLPAWIRGWQDTTPTVDSSPATRNCRTTSARSCSVRLLFTPAHFISHLQSDTVPFCSLAFLDPRVGHTMDVLSPFISIHCHSDWLFHRESCPRLDVVYPGRAWSSSPACTWHCSLHYFFLQAIPLWY